MRCVGWIACLACGACASVDLPGSPLPSDLDLAPPSVSEIELSCDVEADQWSLDVDVTSWSGGGRMYWSPGGDYVERHGVRSVSASPDGEWDRLELRLAIARDWREASSGSITAVRCTDAPSTVFVLSDLQGEVADCWLDGPAPGRVLADLGLGEDCIAVSAEP